MMAVTFAKFDKAFDGLARQGDLLHVTEALVAAIEQMPAEVRDHKMIKNALAAVKQEVSVIDALAKIAVRLRST